MYQYAARYQGFAQSTVQVLLTPGLPRELREVFCNNVASCIQATVLRGIEFSDARRSPESRPTATQSQRISGLGSVVGLATSGIVCSTREEVASPLEVLLACCVPVAGSLHLCLASDSKGPAARREMVNARKLRLEEARESAANCLARLRPEMVRVSPKSGRPVARFEFFIRCPARFPVWSFGGECFVKMDVGPVCWGERECAELPLVKALERVCMKWIVSPRVCSLSNV